MIIESRAPTRIDLAGGTVDIWPLYLFLDTPITLNVGIDLWAEARVETNHGAPGITLKSGDQGAEQRLDWSALDEFAAPPALELHTKLLRHFVRERRERGLNPKGSLALSTRAKSPAGAGLGGSSALSVAIVGVLAAWARGDDQRPAKIDVERDGESFIDVVRDVETTVIKVPAGLQDYYGAMFGGLQSLRWGIAKHRRARLDEKLLRGLEDRLLLFYSGQSRNSGINNWALFKSFVDGVSRVRTQFEEIAGATRQLEKSLTSGDWKGAREAIAAEWEIRRGLAPGITTPEIDEAFALAQKEAGASGKICGAGGGGCFFIFLPDADPALKSRLNEKIGAMPGIRPLPFRCAPEGLRITEGAVG